MKVRKHEIIDLLNRRVRRWKAIDDSQTQLSQEERGARIRELQYILGRVTARNAGIRSIGPNAD